jgi:NAD(P)-dependent dehydrogenase (short-subunit alcohol dehydrogenase family)
MHQLWNCGQFSSLRLNAGAHLCGKDSISAIRQVAEAILMLVKNDYITGETVTVDGGLTMRIP